MAFIYSYKEGTNDLLPMFYTGTEMRPDHITLFVKEGQKWEYSSVQSLMPSANVLGLCPVVSIVTGAMRIINAVTHLFQELQQFSWEEDNPHRAACWIAFKNLIVGIVELIPFSFIGWISLVVYHTAQGCIYVKRCYDETEAQEDIFGIAVDGKIVFTQELRMLDSYLSEDDTIDRDTLRIEALRYLCVKMIKKMSEQQAANMPMATILNLGQNIEKHARGMHGVRG